MPYTYGNDINLKDIDYIVERDEPLIELQPPTLEMLKKSRRLCRFAD